MELSSNEFLKEARGSSVAGEGRFMMHRNSIYSRRAQWVALTANVSGCPMDEPCRRIPICHDQLHILRAMSALFCREVISGVALILVPKVPVLCCCFSREFAGVHA